MAHYYPMISAARAVPPPRPNSLALWLPASRLRSLQQLIDRFSQPAIVVGHLVTGIMSLQPDLYFMVNVTPPGVMVMLFC